MAKLRRGETVSVAALGGSITTGFQASPPDSMGWAGQVADWWRARAKESGGAIKYHNAGVSGTDSAFASVRVKDQVLAFEPDVVFVEFAVNDQWLNAKVKQRSYEGVLRQLLDGSPRAVVLVAVNEKGDGAKSERAGEEKLGNFYGLPTLAWADWAKAKDWDAYYSGQEAIHPNTAGHTSIAQGITAYLDKLWAALPPDEELPDVATALPAPLVSDEFQYVQCLGWETADSASTAGWAEGSDVHGEWAPRGGEMPQGWKSLNSGAHLTVNVRGKSVGILFAESDQYRNGEAWIEDADGKTTPHQVINSFVSYRNGYFGWAYAEVADNLGPGPHVLHVTVGNNGKSGGPANIVGIVCTGVKESDQGVE
jgi:lysophospholipase L1-like esterase